jgi:hypothetical protein
MGILDDRLQRWGLGLLNGAPIPTAVHAAPFGFAPMADGMMPLLANQRQNPPLSNVGEPLIGDADQFSRDTAWGNGAAVIGSKPTADNMIQQARWLLANQRQNPPLPDVGEAPIGDGGQFSRGTAWRAALAAHGGRKLQRQHRPTGISARRPNIRSGSALGKFNDKRVTRLAICTCCTLSIDDLAGPIRRLDTPDELRGTG